MAFKVGDRVYVVSLPAVGLVKISKIVYRWQGCVEVVEKYRLRFSGGTELWATPQEVTTKAGMVALSLRPKEA